MSDPNDKHPGKGFVEVRGYEPPAGTQAAVAKARRLEAERAEEKRTHDDWRRANEEAERRAREQSERDQREQSKRVQEQKERVAKAQKASRTSSKDDKDWSTGWAVLGFFIGAGWAANQVPSSEDAAFPILFAGAHCCIAPLGATGRRRRPSAERDS